MDHINSVTQSRGPWNKCKLVGQKTPLKRWASRGITMQCPRCAYVRQPTDASAEGECPRCGIIYAKFRPGGTLPPSKPATDSRSSSRLPPTPSYEEVSETHKTKIPAWVIPAVLGLVVGYFAGREHIKYELRQTFEAAAERVEKSFGSIFDGGESERKKAARPKRKGPTPLSVTLNRKSFRAADYRASIEAAITIELTFKNLTGKDIRAFDGTLTFTDLLDNTIISAKLAINDPVSSRSQLEWSGQIDYNQFMDTHQRLRNQEFQNLKIRFDTKKVLFSDGSVKEFE